MPQQDSPATPAQRREVIIWALAVASHKWCSIPIWPAAAGWLKPRAESAWFGDAASHGATRSRFEADSEASGQDAVWLGTNALNSLELSRSGVKGEIRLSARSPPNRQRALLLALIARAEA